MTKHQHDTRRKAIMDADITAEDQGRMIAELNHKALSDYCFGDGEEELVALPFDDQKFDPEYDSWVNEPGYDEAQPYC